MCQQSRRISNKIILVTLLIVYSCTVGSRVAGAPQGQAVVPPFVRCLSSTCDLRTHYCDQEIGCASCENDCHPARTAGNALDEQDCKRKCGWYYLWKEVRESTPQPLSSTQSASHAVVFIDNNGMLPGGWTQCSLFMSALLFCVVLLSLGNVVAWILLCRRSSRQQRTGYYCTDRNPHRRPIDNDTLIKSRHSSKNNLYSIQSPHQHRLSDMSCTESSINQDSSQTTLINHQNQQQRQQQQQQQQYLQSNTGDITRHFNDGSLISRQGS